MAARAFFISETYLKDNSPLQGNIDIQELYPFAKIAEQTHIQEAIGTTLYDDLITKINLDNDLSGYPNEKTLCLKIRDAVLWYTCYEAIPFLSVKLRNVGVVKQGGENLEAASSSEVNKLSGICKEKGDFFLKRVQDYLCEFHNLFSAYDTGLNDELNPNVNSPTPGLDIAFDKHDKYNKDDIDTAFYRKWLRS